MNKEFKYYIDEDDNIYNIETKLEKMMINTLASLQKENERLKELCDAYEDEHNTTFKMWARGIKERDELQDRIDKAIEYIGLNKEDLKLYDIYDVNGIELSKILRGKDNVKD